MSFEGYYQQLCKNGHYHTEDIYSTIPDDEWKCPDCGESLAWTNLVDETNGSFYDGERIDNYITLVEKEPARYEKCECCGNRELISPATYLIPGPLKRKSFNPWDDWDEEEENE